VLEIEDPRSVKERPPYEVSTPICDSVYFVDARWDLVSLSHKPF